ncbi:MAG: elongation factor P maturation arginine rhamnosyltransferase EarP, partial [Gallionella sp.]|nr:elongation factor P maturation arginine rhamnosyltransferase EarP [Gallionella sp.]
MTNNLMPGSCDIFCNVIDNYGDIGVSWRLARQLANEFGLAVRLWVDDLASFTRLCPDADAALPGQRVRGVEVRLWNKDFTDAPARSTPVGSPPQCGDPSAVTPADVVIEAFGCAMPESYLAAMTAQ